MLDRLHINFFAFSLSGLLAFLLGLIWYNPKIMRGGGISIDETAPKMRKAGPLPMIASLFLWMLSACFYAFLAQFLGINSEAEYFLLSCLLWVAFATTLNASILWLN